MTNIHPSGNHSHPGHGCHSIPDIERRKWQNPEEILGEIGLKAGDTFMDIGCGYGFFTLPAARIVGKKGKVYGVDVDSDAISGLKQAASKEGLKNMDLVSDEAEKTIFCRGCADIIFFGIDLHDFRDPVQVLRNAREMIKPGGKLIDLDWNKNPSPFGPPLEIRFDEQKAKNLIEAAGFKVRSVSQHGPYHYLIMAY